eukprot:9484202-Pyramimonas_sp.AAC.2
MHALQLAQEGRLLRVPPHRGWHSPAASPVDLLLRPPLGQEVVAHSSVPHPVQVGTQMGETQRRRRQHEHPVQVPEGEAPQRRARAPPTAERHEHRHQVQVEVEEDRLVEGARLARLPAVCGVEEQAPELVSWPR